MKRSTTEEGNSSSATVIETMADVEKDHHFDTKTKYAVIPRIAERSLISEAKYREMYKKSVDDPEAFWSEQAKSKIDWFTPFTQVRRGSFQVGDVGWFLGGKLNVCYNCVDRHLAKHGNDVAIIFEGNEPNEVKRVTYNELFNQVCKLANALKRAGVRKGDNVCIYMPMVPEAAYAMLACARIGAPHSVVFAGFSADALSSRILDASCKVVITADEGKRGPKKIPLKHMTDEAVKDCPCVEKIFVMKHTGAAVNMKPGRDVDMHEAMEMERPFCPPEWMDSEDTLFLLYTSGSTGKPKGVLHTQAGYLLYTSMTHQYIFDYHPGDIYACVADVGWITGHSYIVYGPLSNHATTLMFESIPTYPDAGRYWDLIQRHKVTIFYTAPTAIRTLMKFGTDIFKKYDLSSLRILGTVGEPINPAAWEWYFQHVGQKKCAVVDTYWQTETGGIVLTPLPGATVVKPGSCCVPFFGIQPVLLDEKTGQEKTENSVKGVLALKSLWPSITRTVYGDHKRYLETYMKPYPGYYFTGDGAFRDEDGYIWIFGRVDDVLNVAGHRLGTAEIESALGSHPSCAESAVVAVPHDLKGQAIFVYCVLKEGYKPTQALVDELNIQVRTKISPIATPERIVVVPGLPKTRSGKIMRRILRKIASGETDSLGDISTLAEASVIAEIIDLVKKKN